MLSTPQVAEVAGERAASSWCEPPVGRTIGGVQIMAVPEAATPPQLRAQVVALQQQPWPPTDAAAASSSTLTHDPALHPRSMLLVEGGRVLAALDILAKQLVHAKRRYRAGGLSTVVTRQEARGRGHGGRLVATAHQAMAAGDLDLGLFTCDRPLQGFYESAGWELLPGTVLVGGTPACPFPSDQPGMDKVVMAAFFSAKAQRHRSSFHHARIGLYPGEIDKLW